MSSLLQKPAVAWTLIVTGIALLAAMAWTVYIGNWSAAAGLFGGGAGLFYIGLSSWRARKG